MWYHDFVHIKTVTGLISDTEPFLVHPMVYQIVKRIYRRVTCERCYETDKYD
jgi:hypothetical protein